MFSAREVYAIAVRIEENGERFYRRALETGRGGALKDLLEWVAREEERHREWFLQLMTSTKGETHEPWVEQLSRELLHGAVDTHAFTLDDIDIESIQSEMDVIDTALVLEEDSITFYEFLSAFITEPDVRELLLEIIAEERKHVQELQKQKKSLQEADGAGGL